LPLSLEVANFRANIQRKSRLPLTKALADLQQRNVCISAFKNASYDFGG